MGQHDYGTGFPRSSERFVAPLDMLKTLAAPENSQPICDLLKFAEHPLLRYRIFRAWKSLDRHPGVLRFDDFIDGTNEEKIWPVV